MLGDVSMIRTVPLEPAAEKVCDESSVPPLIFQLPPALGRQRLEEAQNTPVYMYPAYVFRKQVDTIFWGNVTTYFISPEHSSDVSSIIFYTHGAGWVFGSFHTHEKLVRELSFRTNSLVVFPEYSRSPEVKYPVAIEQCYQILSSLPELVRDSYPNIDMNTLTVAGDSVGANMAIAMTFMSKYRQGPKIHKQLLYYPVTNACFNTNSYMKFATNYYLYREGMMWFWDQYTCSEQERCQITASPLRAKIEYLRGLPDAMIINAEADVLRDEGQIYAKKLLCAGVDVTAIQIQATIHDFVMLNALDQTNACRTAMDVSTDWINRKNCMYQLSRI